MYSRRQILGVAFGAMGTGFLGELRGEPHPEWAAELTQSNPAFPMIKPCRLRYQLSWNKVLKAGEAEIVIGKPLPNHRNYWLNESHGRSTGLAGRLWPYRHQFQSICHKEKLRPVHFHAIEEDRSERKITTTKFNNAEAQCTELVINKRTGKKESETKSFRFSPLYDLLSGLLYVRSLPLKPGDESVLAMHPFGSAYLARCRSLKHETIDTPGGRIPAIKCEIKLGKIRRDLTLKRYKKMKRAFVWVSDDTDRLPVLIASEIFVGSVRAALIEKSAI